MLPAWLLCIEQAQGVYALRKDAKTAISGGLSADHPWPAMLYSGRMLPSLHLSAACMPEQSHLRKTAPDLFLLRRAAWLPVSFLHGTLSPLP